MINPKDILVAECEFNITVDAESPTGGIFWQAFLNHSSVNLSDFGLPNITCVVVNSVTRTIRRRNAQDLLVCDLTLRGLLNNND